jgi:hypothetical protein
LRERGKHCAEAICAERRDRYLLLFGLLEEGCQLALSDLVSFVLVLQFFLA